MSRIPDNEGFLPIAWTADERGIATLMWRDDPYGTQIVLSEEDYRRCFPHHQRPWPRLGEAVLPVSAAGVVQARVEAACEENVLTLCVVLRNTSDAPVQMEYVRMALPMDQCFRNNDVFKYEQNVLRHTGLIGEGAYVYWQKPSGLAPVYLMAAQPGTPVQRFWLDRDYAKNGVDAAFEGLYQLELENEPLLLPAHGEKRYAFRVGILKDVRVLPEALRRLGGLGTEVLPGMAVPRGETIRLRLHTERAVARVFFPGGETAVCSLGDGSYQCVAEGAGEKRLTIAYEGGGESQLRFFILDPVDAILQGFAHQVACNQLETNPEDPCYHGLLAWDMRAQRRINSGFNPYDDWMRGGSDEIGLVSGLFLSEKNVWWPDEAQVRVLDLHVRDFIEQRLTEQPGNRVHRMVPWYVMFEPWAGHGADDVWRAFNYVHVANLMLNMYRIAKATRYGFLMEPRHYLRRAFDYATAMFHFWMFPDGKGATEYGNMGEMNLPLALLPALKAEGLTGEAAELEALLRKKAEYFASRKYPFGSEMAFDTTAYEAVYAYGKAWENGALCRRAAQASLGNRARTPVWHKYSVDVRSQGDSSFNVSYMTQLGAWPVADMLLEGTLTDVDAALMAHAGVLAGFTMYNSGGYWDAAPINRNASMWVYDDSRAQGSLPPEATGQTLMSGEAGLGYFGAMYSLCAYVVAHPSFGEVGLGCEVERTQGVKIIRPRPCFGLRVCSMTDGFALACEHGQIVEIVVKPDGIEAALEPLAAHQGEMILRVRGKQAGQWETRRLPMRAERVTLDGLR